jgi:hypothetical protein
MSCRFEISTSSLANLSRVSWRSAVSFSLLAATAVATIAAISIVVVSRWDRSCWLLPAGGLYGLTKSSGMRRLADVLGGNLKWDVRRILGTAGPAVASPTSTVNAASTGDVGSTSSVPPLGLGGLSGIGDGFFLEWRKCHCLRGVIIHLDWRSVVPRVAIRDAASGARAGSTQGSGIKDWGSIVGNGKFVMIFVLFGTSWSVSFGERVAIASRRGVRGKSMWVI